MCEDNHVCTDCRTDLEQVQGVCYCPNCNTDALVANVARALRAD